MAGPRSSSMKARTVPSKRSIKAKHPPAIETTRKSSVGSPTVPKKYPVGSPTAPGTGRNVSPKAKPKTGKANYTSTNGSPKPGSAMAGKNAENVKLILDSKEADLKKPSTTPQSPVHISSSTGSTMIDNAFENPSRDDITTIEESRASSAPSPSTANASLPKESFKIICSLPSKIPISTARLARTNNTKCTPPGTASNSQSSQSAPKNLCSSPLIHLWPKHQTKIANGAKTSLSDLCGINETQRWVKRLEGRMDVIFDQMKVAPNDQKSEEYFANVMRNVYLESCGVEALLLSQFALLCENSNKKSRK
ncbi:hypothetical protein BJ742DRAFT_744297 [Cladochytrium replicatum]|nr:hypothetical protein BJ742DRAFT_744297 [Cladochytrium replicatum]